MDPATVPLARIGAVLAFAICFIVLFREPIKLFLRRVTYFNIKSSKDGIEVTADSLRDEIAGDAERLAHGRLDRRALERIIQETANAGFKLATTGRYIDPPIAGVTWSKSGQLDEITFSAPPPRRLNHLAEGDEARARRLEHAIARLLPERDDEHVAGELRQLRDELRWLDPFSEWLVDSEESL